MLEDLKMRCRFCNTGLVHLVVDLGMSPLSNAFLEEIPLDKKEPFYPLRVYVCHECFLVQLGDNVQQPKEIFSNYLYFSSYSTTWLKHAKDLANEIMKKFDCDQNTNVIEIASNDGYLLQYFKDNNIPSLGIEPAANVAKTAEEKGIKTINKFFGVDTANYLKESGNQADVLLAINVLPHVPDLHDFLKGIKVILKLDGVFIIQFSTYMIPFLQTIEFDSIYHEHFSYFSLLSIQKILSTFGLEIFDVKELSIHGGSLRIYVKNVNSSKYMISQNVSKLIKKEDDCGLSIISEYGKFSNQVNDIKLKICDFFISAKHDGKKIVCYGAPAKANTLLNFCGIGNDFIEYTVDDNPHKQGLYLPGTHIPIKQPEIIRKTKPDYVIILPWNVKEEIMEKTNYIREWNGKFVVLHPKVVVIK
tara:strand:- start:308 stop:1558 length:1251 start_codon:yes stop_codon:yes gene_type:complete